MKMMGLPSVIDIQRSSKKKRRTHVIFLYLFNRFDQQLRSSNAVEYNWLYTNCPCPLTLPPAQQGVLLRKNLCNRVSFSDKNYAIGYYN